jgi:hypothetical protein
MKYTAGTDAAQKIFSGDEWKSARRLLPNGLSFKRNRKFTDKKAAPLKNPANSGIPLETDAR